MIIRQCFVKLQSKMSGMFFETHCSLRREWTVDSWCCVQYINQSINQSMYIAP